MINKLKQAVFLLTASWILGANAGEPITVDKMNLGSCWLTANDTPGGKVVQGAVFSENTSIMLSQGGPKDTLSQFNGALTKYLKKRGFRHFDPSAYTVGFNCTGGGHFILFHLHETAIENAKPLCVWAKQKNGKLTIHDAYPEPAAKMGEQCYGVNPGEILVYLKKGADTGAVVNAIQTQFKRGLQSIQVRPGYFTTSLSVQLKKQSHFKEAEMIRQIQDNPAVKEHASSVALNARVGISGEFKLLPLTGYFEGF